MGQFLKRFSFFLLLFFFLIFSPFDQIMTFPSCTIKIIYIALISRYKIIVRKITLNMPNKTTINRAQTYLMHAVIKLSNFFA